jgi:hypothetical protein
MNQVHRTSVATVLTALLGLSGLAEEPAAKEKSSKKESPKESSAKVVKFESPEACYKALIAAKKNNDPVASLPCFSDAMSNYLLGSMAFNLERMSAISDGGEPVKECQKVLKKHQLFGKDLMGFLQIVDSPGGGGAPLGFMQIGDSIANKPAFMREATAAMLKVQAELEKARPKAEDPKDEPAKKKVDETKVAELKNVKVDGDSASGELVEEGKDEPQPVLFKRQAGSWVVAIAAQEPDFRKPIGGRFKFSDIKADGDSK